MKKLFLLLLLCWQMSLMAQENINLHFDKNFYVLGETIWYAAYLNTDDPTSQKANMLRIDVVSKDGTVQQRNNLSLENGIGKGAIEIPLDWKEGWYTFHAYTIWNPNPTIKNSASVSIPIYDDFKEHQKEVSGKGNTTDNFVSSFNCTIKTTKKKYERREQVTVDIASDTPLNKGSLSITVVPKELVEQTDYLLPIQAEFNTTSNQEPEAINTFYGQIQLTENDKKPLGVGVHYLEDNQVQWTAANEEGIFTTSNELGIRQEAQVFGLFNNQNKTYTTALSTYDLNLTKSLSTSVPSATVLPFNEYIKKYLVQSQQRKKYQEIFDLQKNTLANKDSIVQKEFRPDVVYQISEYASMTSLEEFLREVIPFIKVKRKGGNLSVTMFNESKKFTDKNPLYLIDNKLSYDQEAILNIPISAVESVSVYRTTNTLKQQFGILGNEGVIGIKVKQKESKKIVEKLTNIIPVEGIVETNDFSTRERSFDRMPDFRSLIYWEAGVTIEGGSAQISFPHSDDVGEFSILIKGMTMDGQLFEGATTYEVR